MSLQLAAQHLASKGRGPDTTLVHMAPSEVRSLQKLAKAHGGSLTVNPHTGLQEAGFLSSILPMAVGAGLMMIPGMQPLGAAAITGGLGFLSTGSLQKGLMAGLGAYGGAGLTQGLGALGTSEAGANVSQAAEAAANEAAAAEAAKQQAIQAASSGVGAPPALSPTVGSEAAIQSARDYAANTYMPNAAQQAALNSPYSTGLNAALSSPSKLAAQMGGYGNLAKTGLMAAAPALAGSMPQRQAVPTTQEDTDLGQKYSYNPGTANPFPQANPRGVEQSYFPNQGYTPISNADYKALTGLADGGAVQYPPGEPVLRMRKGGVSEYADDLYEGLDRDTALALKRMGRDAPTKPKLADEGRMKKPAGLSDMAGLEDMEDLRKTKGLYAAGGLSDLGGYSDGGRLLKGPGDGVSDSIPATIGNKRPARLADGEFVVPARIVSELGNGSTDAGARKLYAMLDRVQAARKKSIGKGKVAKNSRADKLLPA